MSYESGRTRSRGWLGATIALVATVGVTAAWSPNALHTSVTLAPPPLPEASTQTAVGTCRSVDVRERRMELITGVALALRVVSFRVASDAEITIEGRSVRLPDLTSGLVLRVEYRTTADEHVATRIEGSPLPMHGEAP